MIKIVQEKPAKVFPAHTLFLAPSKAEVQKKGTRAGDGSLSIEGPSPEKQPIQGYRLHSSAPD
jgi:hypothetical protein